MAMNYRADSPKILLEFLSYHETVKAHSQKTVDEYYLDLRNFFRYMKQLRDPALADCPLDEIDIRDIGIEFIGSITLTDVYSYLPTSSRSTEPASTAIIPRKDFLPLPVPEKWLHFVLFLTIFVTRSICCLIIPLRISTHPKSRKLCPAT